MIKSKRFKDTRTGEIVTQFNILDCAFMEELPDEDEQNSDEKKSYFAVLPEHLNEI